jgi:hypothetical protein
MKKLVLCNYWILFMAPLDNELVGAGSQQVNL